jgi:hypothetical protein|tara:strand:+ start:25 stop:1272 length:1248 start_codon:yes stop_codon:yes gene_type:complete
VSTFKQLNAAADIKTSRSVLNQLVDIIEENISGSNYRKKYQVFVTGGIGPGVTSSMFQTCYDQDYTLQTANAFMDMTVGFYSGSTMVFSASTGVDTSGKVLYPSQSLMMREKVSNYRQMAQLLLGNADSRFTSPFKGAISSADNIDEAMFLNFKRLFSRDKIKKSSFAMKFNTTSSSEPVVLKTNLNITSERGSKIFTDVGAASNVQNSFGGEVGNIVNSSNTSEKVGLIFYQKGIACLDLKKIISGSEHVSGTISAVTSATEPFGVGKVCLGTGYLPTTPEVAGSNRKAQFIPDLMVSGSIDDIVNHLASCRFQSGSSTAITFQNLTNINSTLVFCRATADEFNYSSNPTYVNGTTNKIKVIEAGQENTQRAFSYITTVGLYDENDNLIAVAKTSRPIEKNDEKDITVRVRLDF